MINFFDIDNIFFTALDYPMSYVEFFGTVAGGLAVWLAAKAHILNWLVGVVNVVLFFFLFYQVQLYPDMFLQVFYFVTNLMGWWRWKHPKSFEEDRRHELKVTRMSLRSVTYVFLITVSGTAVLGYFADNLHHLFSDFFSIRSAFPYADSFVTVLSVAATFLMIQKKVESWVCWILVDVVATYLYFQKGIKFVGLEYLVFCFLAIYGLWNWFQEFKRYDAK
jgi:nicotinamide mononucleotide transporter